MSDSNIVEKEIYQINYNWRIHKDYGEEFDTVILGDPVDNPVVSMVMVGNGTNHCIVNHKNGNMMIVYNVNATFLRQKG